LMARQHQRSRLQLTRGGGIFVLVMLLVGGTAVHTQANLLFWLLGLMAGALVVSVVLALLSLRHVEARRLAPGHAVAGDAGVLRYHITNHAWVPIFGLMIVETWGQGRHDWQKQGPLVDDPPMLRGRPHGWVMHIGPRQTMQAEAPCWPRRRGRLAFERIVLSTAFPFGMVRKVVTVEQADELLVYPELHRLNRRLLFSLSDYDPSGQKQLERGGGMEEFFGLRPYRFGDSLKMIDWRHSARTSELVSREMTQPSPPRIMVLVDVRDLDAAVELQPSDEPHAGALRGWLRRRRRRRHAGGRRDPALSPRQRTVERTASLAASLICEAHFQGYQVGLAMLGCRFPRFPVHHSLAHRARMLEALAEFDVDWAGAEDGALPARPSVIVAPGNGTAVSGQRGPAGAVVFGAAQLETYVLEHTTGHDLLQATDHRRTRREQVQRRATIDQDAELAVGAGAQT
ncbi:MAG: DUF58 domain-containing protein, partial [Phycisphaeraceae bacterium]